MFQNITKLALCTVLLFSAGCASSNLSTSTEQEGYGTEAIPAKFRLNSSSLLDDVKIYYHVQVFEENRDARPDSAELIFRIRPGSNQVYLKSRSLNITANDKTLDWPGREWYDISYAPAVKGTITTVKVDYDDLVTIAEAVKVKGSLGGQNFDWPYKSREPMRQFIAQVNSLYHR